MTPDLPGTIYQQMEVSTCNNLKLLVMLYEGAIRFLIQARDAIQNRNVAAKALALDRTLAILGELQSTLMLEEGGEIATSLDRLYTYMTERILEASSKLDPHVLDEVIKLLRILNSAWSEIAQKARSQELSSSNSVANAPPPPSVPVHANESRRSLEFFG